MAGVLRPDGNTAHDTFPRKGVGALGIPDDDYVGRPQLQREKLGGVQPSVLVGHASPKGPEMVHTQCPPVQ